MEVDHFRLPTALLAELDISNVKDFMLFNAAAEAAAAEAAEYEELALVFEAVVAASELAGAEAAANIVVAVLLSILPAADRPSISNMT